MSGAFVTFFRVFFAKPSKCEWSHPSQVFLCFSLTFSWTVSRLKPSGVRCWRTFELWGPFCGLVSSLCITKVLFFQSPILNIDIAPTIVELAGGKAPESMDGRSILPLLVCSFEPLFTFFLLVLLLLLLSFAVVYGRFPKVRTGRPERSFWKWNISIFSEFVLKLTTTVHTIERFHSRGQHLC